MTINWEAMDLGKKIDRLRAYLRDLENPKNLFEVAFVTSNKDMYKQYASKIKRIKKEIEDLEEQLEHSIIEHNEMKKEKRPHPLKLKLDGPKEDELIGLTEYDDFDFCDDVKVLANIADKFDRAGMLKLANKIDELIENIIKR
jgi:hypothetical protein